MDRVEKVVPLSDQMAENFFRREERLFVDFSEGLGVSFKQGKGWAVSPETGEATYDPNFFVERGYSETQAIFASLHEIDHVKEQSQLIKTPGGKDVWQRRKTLLQQRRRLNILDNCLKDVADNRRVLDKVPALDEETTRLYREKLWPSSDMTKSPKHLQFAYAILRQSMLPNEEVIVDPRVNQALEELRHVKGKSGKERDIVAIVTDPALDPLTKIKLSERYVEPAFEQLFEEDIQEKSKQENQSQSGQSSRQQNPEDSFSDDYDEYERRVPQAMSESQIETAASSEVGGKDVSSRQAAGYEKEHGVSAKDAADYYSEYRQIEQYLEPMRAQFRRIVSERLVPRRKLSGLKDEGVIIEPGLAGQALVDINRGIIDSPVYKDFEGQIRKEQVPSAFELSGVFDRSGSMESGGKKEEQRRAAILLMEALKEFMEQPEVRDGVLDPDIRAASEVRSFGGGNENIVVKPLSPLLAEKERINVFKVLGSCPGGATQDYISLGQIADEMRVRGTAEHGYLEKVRSRVIKKLVVVFSDGASSDQDEYNKKKAELEAMGVKVVDYRRIRDNANFTSQMSQTLAEALDDLCYPRGDI